jgi:predicted AlkP superfamily phosphohydrolase/phosphomutase/tetratricopeptide (TPR) repeat protein
LFAAVVLQAEFTILSAIISYFSGGLMGKVLLIGWDAADWKVIEPLMEQGRMPHTRALVERGTMGNLTTLRPVLSPMLWTSIATGKRPFKHGVLGFSEPTPDGAGVQPVSHHSRNTKALWNIFNQQGKRSIVVGWWPSHPVEPINGAMVSDHFHTAVGPIGPEDPPWPVPPGAVWPPELAKPLGELRVHPNELDVEQVSFFVPDAAGIDQDKDKRLGSVMKTLAEAATLNSAATWLMEHQDWDLCAVYFDAIDHFCHGFMKYHPPRRDFIPEADYERYKGVVEAGYCFHDMMLARMLALAGDDATVIICSDHGFHPDEQRPRQIPSEPAGPAIEHRDLGMLLMAGPGIKHDALVHGASLLDITPTILALSGIAIGDDMDGRPLLQALDNPPELQHIPSWDEVDGADGRLDPGLHTDPLASKQAMDQLVALGYIEEPGEDRKQAVDDTVRELRYNLARSYMDAGRHVDAAPILRELYEAQPDQYRFGVQLAMCYRAMAETAALRALVERLTKERRQSSVEAREALAKLAEKLKLRRAEKGKEADGLSDHQLMVEAEQKELKDLQLMARFSPYDMDFLMGCVLTDEGEYEQALVHLRRAGQAERRRPGLHIQIGEALLRLRRWDEAEQVFRQVLTIDPLNPHGFLGIARTLLPRRQAKAAAEAALECIQLHYHYPLAHYMLGLALVRLRKFEHARDALTTAVTLNPNFAQAHRVLVRLYTFWIPGQPLKRQEHLELLRQIRRAKAAAVPISADDPLRELAADDVGDAACERSATGELAHDRTTAEPPSLDPSSEPGPFVTVVAGLPRSGTSMLMQMLAAGGLALYTDGKRSADEDNPRGYFEAEDATRLHQHRDWVAGARGKAVKVVAQLLPMLPGDQRYRVLFIERDPAEVLRSQKVMLERLGRPLPKLSDDKLAQAYAQQVRRVKLWMVQRPNVEVLFLSHIAVIEDPEATAQRIDAFLGASLDQGPMVAAVDPTLHRQRRMPSSAELETA